MRFPLTSKLAALFRRQVSANRVQPPPPTVEWLLHHRKWSTTATVGGRYPLASLYRMYEYVVMGFTAGLRTEIEFFFNQPTWSVALLPDPQDPDPERYAILSCLPFYLCLAFNRLIVRGLRRDSPAIISPEMLDEMRRLPPVLEEEPVWVKAVAKLDHELVIPTIDDNVRPDKPAPRFQQMNIIVEELHVLFV